MTSPSHQDPSGPSTVGASGERSPWSAPFALASNESLGFIDAIEQVEAALRFGIDPSLEPICALLEELGHPESSMVAVQVAGTNGKTSTARFAAALLGGEGLCVGLYTSPHLVDYTERMEIDGQPVSRAVFARGVSWALAAWKRIVERGDKVAAQGCTEFELLTAAAMVMFAEMGVEVVVLEVGLGGRWDATSAVPTIGAAVTGIGLDHTRILGDTLEAIAAEKAPVLHALGVAVLGTHAVRPPEVLAVMLERCAAVQVVPTMVNDAAWGDDGLPANLPRATYAVRHRPSFLGDDLVLDVDVAVYGPEQGPLIHAVYEAVTLVAPLYQAQNIACALALATGVLGRPLDVQEARASLAACKVPGRFEVLCKDPLVVVDACHNPQSAEAFAEAVADAEPQREHRPLLLLGALADKDYRGIVEVVAPLFEHIAVTQSTSERAVGARDLAAEVERVTGRAPEAVYDNVQAAVVDLCGESFVGCGTITLIGELAALLR